MNERFRRYLLGSTATHLGIVVFLVAASLIVHVRRKKKPHEITTYIDLQAAPELPSLQPVEKVNIPEPPKPEPPRDIPEPVKKKKKKIKKSTRRIKRKPAATPKKSELTPEEIKKLLAAGLKPSTTASKATAEAGWYLALVRQRMYDAWAQPSELAGRGLMAVVSIRVLRNGVISEREMVRSSGNTVMDQSVMRAVETVKSLKPLPAQYAGPYHDITIEFELTGGEF